MAEDSRPNPDEILARISAGEEQKKRGRLKIFLGYAAGVGKTYTMLEAARQRKKEADVVIAYVETHGRAETEALLEGLEIIPRRQVEHHGLTITEMDLDAVLRRHPHLALVDELAHTNTPDSRHPKRYQDVEELLDAGIDVYTTLNVQHVESLRNLVSQITTVWVRETVPDSIIDKASEIELVDLPPDELLKRLKEGKVYIGEQIVRAANEFFRKGNLTALRELSMRTAAEHVDDQMRAYMEAKSIPGPWPTAERILVCINPGLLGNHLVRAGRRLASQLNAEWLVLFVETDAAVKPDQQDRLMSTLKLAERLGAQKVTIQGHNIASTVIEYARKNNITKILVGKSEENIRQRLFRSSVEEQIIRQSEFFDVFIVSGKEEPARQEMTPQKESSFRWQGYLRGLALVVLATLLSQIIHELFSPAITTMLYLLCIVITAIFWGFGPSILISILSVLAFDFFFIPPQFTLVIPDTEYLITFITLLLVGVIISYLTSRVRRQIVSARQHEKDTATLYALSRDMAVANDMESYLHAIIARTKETFGHDTVIFLPDPEQEGLLKPYAGNAKFAVEEKEFAAAVWSFQQQKIAGHGTDTLPNARARYIPLITARGTIGILSLWYDEASADLTMQQERLLGAYADLAAVAIEGILLADEAHRAQISKATEKLQTALLNSISNDLRIPLESVIKALRNLKDEGVSADYTSRENMVQVARKEAETLNHLITNFLDMSRIEAGVVKIIKKPSPIGDLIGAALKQLEDDTAAHKIKIDFPSKLPLVSVDFSLIVQALVNILDNAFKYAPPDSPVEISVRETGQAIELEIADRGVGIPAEDLVHVFDKFYRVQRPDNVVGTGLGLSICKGFIEAHGGRIWAENRAGGGTVIKLTLPTA